MLHAAALQSRHGHARIASIDASRAPALRVHLVLTAADLGALNAPTPLLIPHPNLTAPRTQRPLVTGDVRYMGELVAFVIADDRYVAEDAVELIDVRYEPLTAAVDLETAAAGGALVRQDVPGNRPGRLAQRVGDPDGAFARADRVLSERLYVERSCGSPIESAGWWPTTTPAPRCCARGSPPRRRCRSSTNSPASSACRSSRWR